MKGKRFSVIIPTYNRPEALENCLESLGKQNVPVHSFEVIVVDDGSQTKFDFEKNKARVDFDLKIIFQDNKGPAEARNAGARKAIGEYLLFTDDDCQPDPNWAKRLIEQLDENPDKAVGGKTTNGLHDNLFAEASQLLNSFLYTYYNHDNEKAKFFTSNNLALTKFAFFEIEGFSTKYTTYLSEDRNFCDKWINSGKSMKYIPDALVYHFHKMGFVSFFFQHFNYGKGARLFHLERQERNQARPSIEPMSFYVGMLAFPFREEGNIRAAILSLLIGITQIFHFLGYIWQRFVARI